MLNEQDCLTMYVCSNMVIEVYKFVQCNTDW